MALLERRRAWDAELAMLGLHVCVDHPPHTYLSKVIRHHGVARHIAVDEFRSLSSFRMTLVGVIEKRGCGAIGPGGNQAHTAT